MKLPNSSRILRIFHNCGFCPFSSKAERSHSFLMVIKRETRNFFVRGIVLHQHPSYFVITFIYQN
ncbi:hypothetical protein Hanom_Chr02g00125761 [Helianthus anomalus]